MQVKKETMMKIDKNKKNGLEAKGVLTSHNGCNGGAGLNNQRPVSPHGSLPSGQHSLRSSLASGCSPIHQRATNYRSGSSQPNSLHNRIPAPHSISDRRSVDSEMQTTPCSGTTAMDDYTWNDLMQTAVPAKEHALRHVFAAEDIASDDDDDDDEGDLCNYAWCPEPKGCFKTRVDFTFYILPPTNRFRIFCRFLIGQRWFDYSILIIIALNCITLAMERPDIPANCIERQFLTISNYVFTVTFAVEIMFKAEERHRVLVESREEFGRSLKNVKNTNTEDRSSSVKLDQPKLTTIQAEPIIAIKNNKEKERLMRQQLPSVTVTKEDATLSTSDVFGVPVAPPIIIHTAATPLATPPNWSPSPLNRGGDVNLARNLSTTSTMSQSSASMDATSINPDQHSSDQI